MGHVVLSRGAVEAMCWQGGGRGDDLMLPLAAGPLPGEGWQTAADLGTWVVTL